MDILYGTMIKKIDDEILKTSYELAKKVLETGLDSHLRPFVAFKTFKGDTGVYPIPNDLDMEEDNSYITDDLKELCSKKKISDIYITIEMQRTFDENGLPIMNPEYYLLITHETHLFSDVYASRILFNENERMILSPLYKIDKTKDNIGPFFNILCPKKFHEA